jgi:Cof subfamily protein (haloacid dehalogenase superfamily)
LVAISSCIEVVRLLVSDIDGTLVTKDKRLTEATHEAVGKLARAGIALALTSSRPPHGIEVFAAALKLNTPRAAFNGAVIVSPDGQVLSGHFLQAETAGEVLAHLRDVQIAPWLFTAKEWLLVDPQGDYVEWEARTVKMPFRQVESFDAYLGQAGKIMAASKDTEKLAQCERDLQAMLGQRASVHLSQTYYLDITHPEGTKGHAVRALARLLGIDMKDVAVIGDMENDVPMFEVAPLSIAMGQSPDDVKRRATYVTAGNEDDGWAKAMTEYILPHGA